MLFGGPHEGPLFSSTSRAALGGPSFLPVRIQLLSIPVGISSTWSRTGLVHSYTLPVHLTDDQVECS